MNKHTVRFIVTILILLLVMVGCSQSEVKERENEQKQNEAIENNELTLAIGSEPDAGFDPTTGWGRYGSPLFQSTLFKKGKDLEIVNDIATNYKISNDGLVWTVEIREDVLFSDGVALTAEDVHYTFEKARESGSIVDLTILDDVKVISDYTVEFSLKEAQSTFIHTLAATGIVPKHGHNSEYAQKPIGSGPFTFVQWDKGQQLIVKANPNYYGQEPYFKKITFLFLNEDAAFAAAKAGQTHISAIPAAFGTQAVKGMKVEALQSVDNRGIAFPVVPSGEVTESGFPIGNDVTADVAIRQAINMAVDRSLLVEGVLEGFGTPAFSSVDGLPWWNSETVIEDGHMAEAKRILAEAGWEDQNGDGILEKGSLSAQFTLIYPASDITRQSLAIAVADMIEPLGIKISVEGKSWDDIEAMMYANAVMFGWGSHDPLEMFNLYSTETAGLGWYNTGFYSNPTVDEYMAKALAANDIEKANEYWKLAQWDGETGFSAKGDAPWAWLVNIDHVYLVDERLNIGEQKIQPHGHGWPITDNIADWVWSE